MDYKDQFEKEEALRKDTEKKHADLVSRHQDTERELRDLKAAIGDTPVPELKALAVDGKAYRDGLVDDMVKAARQLKMCGDTPEAVEDYKKFVATWPVKNLKSEVERLGAEVAVKFPDTPQLPGEDGNQQRTPTKDADGVDFDIIFG